MGQMEVIDSHDDTIELPVDAGNIKFTLDIDKIKLLKDKVTGEESLDIRVSLRGVSSSGNPLDISTDQHLVAS